MYLHIGNNKNIREKTIIGIFDTDTATVSTVTRKFLSGAEKKGLVESSTDEIPKSFVLFGDEKEARICFSQLSTAALLGRSGNEQN
ncbi:MAG: DUF370 domain-containing protein [Clostridia bacterium]|nr:DUF370 domain-containing protein [Clostridia bacterium]